MPSRRGLSGRFIRKAKFFLMNLTAGCLFRRRYFRPRRRMRGMLALCRIGSGGSSGDRLVSSQPGNAGFRRQKRHLRREDLVRLVRRGGELLSAVFLESRRREERRAFPVGGGMFFRRPKIPHGPLRP